MDHESAVTNYQTAAAQLVGLMENQQEEMRQIKQRRDIMECAIEMMEKEVNELEMEKKKLEAEIMSLKLRDKVYQTEQSNLRNSIAIIKFQIEKIKDSIENTERSELEELKKFEKVVGDITEKFRSIPAIYDRRNLSEKMEEEEEKRKLLLQKIEETREAYANFNREKGLRERNNENEELLNCVLPGSELYYLIEMTKNLDEVIRGMKESCGEIEEKEAMLIKLDSSLASMRDVNPTEVEKIKEYSKYFGIPKRSDFYNL